MHGVTFLQDLAVVMIVAGLVTLLFRRLRQPVVLGYILAGLIIGPHTPPFPLVKEQVSIQTLADLGMVFLMFSLGLDFSFRKLRQVGLAVALAGAFEIVFMVWLGYELGFFFGWSSANRVLLGIIMAMTSTTIIVKSLRDRGQLHERHALLISGMSIVEDIFVILVMVFLPAVAATGELRASELAITLLRLFTFLVAAVVVGLLAVPRLLRYVGRLQSNEMLLVTVLGLCFGFSLLAVRLGYSVALGAFLMGALVAESREVGRVQVLMEPLRDLFSAVFFVAIGMMIEPRYLWSYAGPVAAVTLVFIVGKFIGCSFGTFMAGQDGRTAVRVGAGMAQLGEFAFVLTALGASLRVSGDFLYPIAVGAAALNAVLRPYLVDNADRLAEGMARLMPTPLAAALGVYSRWVAGVSTRPRSAGLKIVRSLAWQITLNLALIAAIFITMAFLARYVPDRWLAFPAYWGGRAALLWLAAALVSLVVLIATVRKMQALAMLVGELATAGSAAASRTAIVRALLSRTAMIGQLAALLLVILAASSALLPPLPILIGLLAVLMLVGLIFGTAFNRWYSRAKFALLETWHQSPPAVEDVARPMPALLREAQLQTVAVTPGPAAGRLIRELQLRTATGASIVALERDGRTLVNPGPDEELRAGDQVLLLGDQAQLEAAKAMLGG